MLKELIKMKQGSNVQVLSVTTQGVTGEKDINACLKLYTYSAKLVSREVNQPDMVLTYEVLPKISNASLLHMLLSITEVKIVSINRKKEAESF